MRWFLGRSWKTSLGALMVASGYLVEVIVDPAIGNALKTGGTALIGLSARDNLVSTEEAKAG